MITNDQYPEGTSYVMEIAHADNPTASWEEAIPERLNGEDLRRFAPEYRAHRCVNYWNKTLRPTDKERVLVAVFRVQCTKTRITPLPEEKREN